MKKMVVGSKVSFYDNEKEIMYIDFFADECVWYFDSSSEVTITSEMDLYEPIKSIMTAQYDFGNDFLKSSKDDNKLVWYSDCYYDPDNEWSSKTVSYLEIVNNGNTFTLKCTKPLDGIISRNKADHYIVFSPLGNGKRALNVNTGTNLQDDFVINVYQKLLIDDRSRTLHV